MIYQTNSAKQKINNLNVNDLYIVSDFDRTITSYDSISSWGALCIYDKLPESFYREVEDSYNKYRPIELDLDLKYAEKSKEMQAWSQSSFQNIINHSFKKEWLEEIADRHDFMEFRDGFVDFLKFTNQHNIPVIIISAGIGDIIKMFLDRNGCRFNNVFVVSNFFEYKNGIVSGLERDIIHTLNKSQITFTPKIQNVIQNREQILLFGDLIDDIYMINEDKHKNALKVGFLDGHQCDDADTLEEYRDNFDIVATKESNFTQIKELLFSHLI